MENAAPLTPGMLCSWGAAASDAHSVFCKRARSPCTIHGALLMPGALATTSTGTTARSRWALSCRAAALRVVLFWTLLPAGTASLELPSFDLDLALPRRRPGRPGSCLPMALGASLRSRPASFLLGRALSSTSSLAASSATASARRVAAACGTRSAVQSTCAATPWGLVDSAASRRRGPVCSANAAGMSSSSASAAEAAAEAASVASAPSAPSSILDGATPAEPASRDGGHALATLETLEFDNTFTAELPGDSSESNVPRQVGLPEGVHFQTMCVKWSLGRWSCGSGHAGLASSTPATLPAACVRFRAPRQAPACHPTLRLRPACPHALPAMPAMPRRSAAHCTAGWRPPPRARSRPPLLPAPTWRGWLGWTQRRRADPNLRSSSAVRAPSRLHPATPLAASVWLAAVLHACQGRACESSCRLWSLRRVGRAGACCGGSPWPTPCCTPAPAGLCCCRLLLVLARASSIFIRTTSARSACVLLCPWPRRKRASAADAQLQPVLRRSPGARAFLPRMHTSLQRAAASGPPLKGEGQAIVARRTGGGISAPGSPSLDCFAKGIKS